MTRQLADKLNIPYAYFERMRENQPALLDRNGNCKYIIEPRQQDYLTCEYVGGGQYDILIVFELAFERVARHPMCVNEQYGPGGFLGHDTGGVCLLSF